MNTFVKIVVFLVLLNLAIGLLSWAVKKLFFFGLIAGVVYFIYRTFFEQSKQDHSHV